MSLDLTVCGTSINVQEHETMLNAVRAAARAENPEEVPLDDDDNDETPFELNDENLVDDEKEGMNKAEEFEEQAEEQVETATTPVAEELVEEEAPPSAPSAPAVQAPLPPPAVEEVAVIVTEETFVAPEKSVTPVVEEVAEAAEQVPAAPTAPTARPMKAKPVRVKTTTKKSTGRSTKTSRRQSMSSLSAGAPKPARKSTDKRGRTKERTTSTIKTHRRASSSSGGAKKEAPSYLRPTRSSSLSHDRALKRKQNRLSLSVSRSKKTGFGGHTYVSEQTSKRSRGTTASRSLTEPQAFRLSTGRRKREVVKKLTTEEQECQAMQVAQRQMERKRKKNEQGLRRALAGAPTFSATSTKAPTITESKEFSFSTSTRSARRQSEATMSTEERELAAIAMNLEATKRLRVSNEKTKSVALSAAGKKHRVARSNKKLTEASSPNLRSRSRPKANLTQRKKRESQKGTRGGGGGGGGSSSRRFGAQLRTSRPTATGAGPVKAGGGMKQLTRPSTPHFETDRRAKQYKEMHQNDNDGTNGEKMEPFVPLAEQVKRLTTRVPDRFHSKSKHHKPSSTSSRPMRLTEPKAPTFATDTRAAAHTIPKSTEELEMEEMNAIEAQPFKAKPVDPRVMNSAGDLGVPRLSKKPLTQCASPNFRVDKRASVERSSTLSSSMHNEETSFKPFKAREIGEGVSQGFSGASSSSNTGPKAPTEFAPFSLSSSRRVVKTELEVPAYKPFKARPVPLYTAGLTKDAPQVVRTKELTKPLTPKLSSFSQRHKDAQKATADKIAAEREAEMKLASSFRARDIGEGVPAPNYNSSSYQPPTLTEITPFNISSDPTGKKSRADMRLLQEEKEMDKARKFKARSIPQTHAKPFSVHKSTRPLCEVKNVVLQSDKRAQERARFEKKDAERRAQEEKEKVAKKAVEEAELNAKIDAELESIRFHSIKSTTEVHQFLHKAPLAIKQSELELCTPQSPMLLTSSRVRHQEN